MRTFHCFVIDVESVEVGAGAVLVRSNRIRGSRPPGPIASPISATRTRRPGSTGSLFHRVPTAKRSDCGGVARRGVAILRRIARTSTSPSKTSTPRSRRTEAIGGRLKYPPTVYPVPRVPEGARPLIDWAVMQEPFGNEFCLVRELHTPSARAWQSRRAGGAEDAPGRHPSAATHDAPADNSHPQWSL